MGNESADRVERQSLLCLDVGNTSVTAGLFAGRRLLGRATFGSDPARGAESWGIELAALGRDLRIDHVVVASVVPALEPRIAEAARLGLGVEPLIVDVVRHAGIEIRCQPPESVGADRVANAVAAYDRFRSPCIAVDFGTATTFDVVGDGGAFLGGAIVPGLKVCAEALRSRGARLPLVEARPTGSPIGMSTEAAIAGGLYYGYVGLVEGLLERIRLELGGNPPVIGTGGLASTLECRGIDTIDHDLTLHGLRLIWERNRR
jgi:type III pantothenate kinase